MITENKDSENDKIIHFFFRSKEFGFLIISKNKI